MYVCACETNCRAEPSSKAWIVFVRIAYKCEWKLKVQFKLRRSTCVVCSCVVVYVLLYSTVSLAYVNRHNALLRTSNSDMPHSTANGTTRATQYCEGSVEHNMALPGTGYFTNMGLLGEIRCRVWQSICISREKYVHEFIYVLRPPIKIWIILFATLFDSSRKQQDTYCAYNLVSFKAAHITCGLTHIKFDALSIVQCSSNGLILGYEQ